MTKSKSIKIAYVRTNSKYIVFLIIAWANLAVEQGLRLALSRVNEFPDCFYFEP